MVNNCLVTFESRHQCCHVVLNVNSSHHHKHSAVSACNGCVKRNAKCAQGDVGHLEKARLYRKLPFVAGVLGFSKGNILFKLLKPADFSKMAF